MMPLDADELRIQQLVSEALRGAINPIFITDSKGAIVWINEAFSRQYGYQLAEIVGQTPRILQSGKHGAGYYHTMWSALQAGRGWSGETVDRGSDGAIFTVRQTISPVRQGGRITHFLGVHIDITQEAELAAIGELQRGTEELSGLMTRASYEERIREILDTAAADRLTPAMMLISIRTRLGEAPRLQAEATAFLYGVLGERIRRVLGENAVVGNFGGFDFYALLSESDGHADLLPNQLNRVVSEAIPFLGDSLQLACRTAVATFPADGGTVDELRKAADRRLSDQRISS